MNIYYECSICGYRNLNRESVETCENNHTKKDEIEIIDINFEEGYGIPRIIVVKIKDITLSYKRR